jgi:hypothetical protein
MQCLVSCTVWIAPSAHPVLTGLLGEVLAGFVGCFGPAGGNFVVCRDGPGMTRKICSAAVWYGGPECMQTFGQ